MISRFIISAIACLLVLCSQVYSASIEFTEELVYTIPGIDKVDEAFFNDVDFDGVPEILARRTNHIVAYSLTGDSVFFETDIDTATYRKLIYADINRDSITDIAVACFHNYNGHSDSALMIAVYDGADNYSLSRRYYPNAERIGDLWLIYSAALSSFKALDINHDGYNELLLSYCNWIWDGGAGPPAHIWHETQYPISRLYFNYPDSVIWQITRQLADPVVMTGAPENRFLMANNVVEYSYDYGTENYIQNTSIFRLYTNLVDYYIMHDSTLDYAETKQGCEFIYRSDKHMLNCAGNFVSADGDFEFVSTFYYLWDCVDPMFPYYDPEVLVTEIRAYRMPTPDSAELIWWKEYIDYKDYVFLPDQPGFFFAFLGDRFVQIDGATGEEVLSTLTIPSGARHWDYPFSYGQPYLITFSANTVTVYKPDVITDIDDHEDPPIPTMLDLGQPYPNPFNATQTIPVTTRPGRALTVDVYNLLGQKIDCIYSGVAHTQQLNLTWKADKFASGIYLIRAVSEDETAIVKTVLLK